MHKRGFDDPERRVDIGLHGPVELFSRDNEDRVVRLLAPGIADDDIEAPRSVRHC
jgi:hypothetical protein